MKAQRICASYTLMRLRPALFLDRDGVMIEDLGYVNSLERTKVLPTVVEAIQLARKAGFFVFVVTNQAGIARGLFSENECIHYNIQLMELFESLNAPVDEFVFCPSHPDFGSRIECNCRKPKTGMLDFLIESWNVDQSKSLLIGDKDSDILAGQKANLRSVLVNSSSNLVLVVKEHLDLVSKHPPVRITPIEID